MLTTPIPRRAALALAAALLLAAPVARAAEVDPALAEAKRFFETGRQLYEKSRFALAASAFEEAYRLSPRPPVLFSLAQAHRQQFTLDGDPARLGRAVELFRTYVAEVPSGGRREHALEHLADLEPQLSRLDASRTAASAQPPKLEAKTQLMVTSRTPGATVAIGEEEGSEVPVIRELAPGRKLVRVEAEGFSPEVVEAVVVEGRLVAVEVNLEEIPALVSVDAPEGADIALDGRIVGTAPLHAPLEVSSGRHLLVVLQRGSYGHARELNLARGEVKTVKVALESTVQRHLAWWFVGGGGALVAAGAVAGLLALGAEEDAAAINDRRVTVGALTAADLTVYQDNLDRRDALAPPAFGLLGAGAVAATTGLLLYLLDSPRVDAAGLPSSSIRANLGPSLVPGGIGASLGGSF
jgi:hypothetical protein